MSGPTTRIRQIVLERDNHTCQWCGHYVFGEPYSLQHRRARGAGGTSRPGANEPANLIVMCGTATTGCHGHIEVAKDSATARGFRLSLHIPDEDIPDFPVYTYRGKAWLDNDGGVRWD